MTTTQKLDAILSTAPRESNDWINAWNIRYSMLWDDKFLETSLEHGVDMAESVEKLYSKYKGE